MYIIYIYEIYYEVKKYMKPIEMSYININL